MSKIFVNLTETESSFWEINPEFKLPFNDLYTEDKSKGKKESSKIMWFISLCFTRSSKYFKLSTEGIYDNKLIIIGEDYCGDKDFYKKNKKLIDEVSNKWITLQYSAIERHLKTWEDLLDKRTEFLRQQEYRMDNYDDLDKMAVGTTKVYDAIKNLNDLLNKEEADGVVKGGSVASLND